ncbi:MAG: helix-turn-helix domain-containing protein [Eubacterium sp.]|nr:helix-turn-helix domain-containing protein [Eubacterium sp.]
MEKDRQTVNEIISANLTRLRELYGMKKKDVALTLGVKPNTYRIWENINGKNGIKNYYLLQLAKIYGVSVDYLMQPHEDGEATITDKAKISPSSKLAAGSPLDDGNIYGDRLITELSDYEKIFLMQLRRLNTTDRQKVSEVLGSLLDTMDRINGGEDDE